MKKINIELSLTEEGIKSLFISKRRLKNERIRRSKNHFNKGFL